MPVYLFKCYNCEEVTERILQLSKSDIKRINCDYCGQTARKIPAPFMGHVANTELNKYVKKVERNGGIIREPGIKKDVKRNKKYQEEATRKRIRKVVEDTVSEF